jgi:hypothetical protein
MPIENLSSVAREFEFQLLLVRAELICRAIAQHIEAHHHDVVSRWESAWAPIAAACVDLQRWSNENKSKTLIDVEDRPEIVEQVTQSVTGLCASVQGAPLTDAELDLVVRLHDLAVGLGKFYGPLRAIAGALPLSGQTASSSAEAHMWSGRF